MIFIERLTKNISSIIYDNSNIKNDEKEIIEYGIVILSLKIFGILFIIIFGSLFKVLLQSIVFYFATSELRKFSGGVHSNSPSRCIFIGTFISIIISLFISKIYISLPIYIILF
ncbi:accessory gene regulator B family protein [Clostridium pasteurianum]|uniref:accessory gene regulator B family protein n=1 Tax=Clostridium pasteurianum TaxID=1501 RepID=UPI0003A3AAAC|nr:accessory gene regulator B family protein [Clostridium pasteurianum]